MKHRPNTSPWTLDPQTLHNTLDHAQSGLDALMAPMHDMAHTLQQAWASVGLADLAAAPGQAVAGGRFETHRFSNEVGARSYKLYVPAQAGPAQGVPRPMVVMLHGCTQSADDFAAGTQMNRWADQHGFLVLYPEQAAQANPAKCWNWFNGDDQLRDAGEPALIAGIVREVVAQHAVDGGRIFVAGLSAGAAMAVILGQTYPELFAAVGAHSGLPYARAHDVSSALALMQSGRSPAASGPETAAALQPVGLHAVPTIVFHGDRDHTVQHSNGQAIVQQACEAYLAEAGQATLLISTHPGTSADGRGYSRTVHTHAAGHAHIESWTLHGAGHAWSGGDARGSYTDDSGPDASAQMLRFFLALPGRAAAASQVEGSIAGEEDPGSALDEGSVRD